MVALVSDVVVRVDAGSALGDVIVVVRVMVVGSLQPNQPGDLQEDVVIVLVMVVVGVVVVDSSRQPHQPGVLQVSVRVCEVVLDGLLVLLVVVSLLLLSKNFQLKQS
jgi:F0F1-type ATP synthase membrane subunit c/vacuolar-type H+-ATPase subunit K